MSNRYVQRWSASRQRATYVFVSINSDRKQETKRINWLVDWCLTALSVQTDYTVQQEYEIYYVGPGDKTNTHLNNETIH